MVVSFGNVVASAEGAQNILIAPEEVRIDLFSKQSGAGGSTVGYERELVQYKKYLNLLDAPVAPAHWAVMFRRSVGDSVKFLGGGAILGALGVLMARTREFRRLNSDEKTLLTFVAMVYGGGFLSMVYFLVKALMKAGNSFRDGHKFISFLYEWPAHREGAPEYIKDLIEPYYAQLYVDGAPVFNAPQAYQLYTFLVATMNARLLELRAAIGHVKASRHTTWKTRLKEKIWPF